MEQSGMDDFGAVGLVVALLDGAVEVEGAAEPGLSGTASCLRFLSAFVLFHRQI